MSYKSFDWELIREPELEPEQFRTQPEWAAQPGQPAPIVKTVLN